MWFRDVVVLLPEITGSALAIERGRERAMTSVVAER